MDKLILDTKNDNIFIRKKSKKRIFSSFFNPFT